MKSLTASFYSLFVFGLALQARQNTAQLVKILSDILHIKTSIKIYVFTKFEGRSWTRRRLFIFLISHTFVKVFPANVAYPTEFRQQYGKLENLSECLLAKLQPSNLVNTIFYPVF